MIPSINNFSQESLVPTSRRQKNRQDLQKILSSVLPNQQQSVIPFSKKATQIVPHLTIRNLITQASRDQEQSYRESLEKFQTQCSKYSQKALDKSAQSLKLLFEQIGQVRSNLDMNLTALDKAQNQSFEQILNQVQQVYQGILENEDLLQQLSEQLQAVDANLLQAIQQNLVENQTVQQISAQIHQSESFEIPAWVGVFIIIVVAAVILFETGGIGFIGFNGTIVAGGGIAATTATPSNRADRPLPTVQQETPPSVAPQQRVPLPKKEISIPKVSEIFYEIHPIIQQTSINPSISQMEIDTKREQIELGLDIGSQLLYPATFVTTAVMEVLDTLVFNPICEITSPLSFCPILKAGVTKIVTTITKNLPDMFETARTYGVSEQKINTMQQRLLDTVALMPLGKVAQLTKGAFGATTAKTVSLVNTGRSALSISPEFYADFCKTFVERPLLEKRSNFQTFITKNPHLDFDGMSQRLISSGPKQTVLIDPNRLYTRVDYVSTADKTYQLSTHAFKKTPDYIHGWEVSENIADRSIFFHSTDGNALNSILKSGYIEPRQVQGLKGAFVSTALDDFFGDYTLLLGRGVEKSSILTGGPVTELMFTNRGFPSYWGGLDGIALADSLQGVAIGMEHSNIPKKVLDDASKRYSDILGRHVPVVSTQQIKLYSQERSRKHGAFVPNEWPENFTTSRVPSLTTVATVKTENNLFSQVQPLVVKAVTWGSRLLTAYVIEDTIEDAIQFRTVPNLLEYEIDEANWGERRYQLLTNQVRSLTKTIFGSEQHISLVNTPGSRSPASAGSIITESEDGSWLLQRSIFLNPNELRYFGDNTQEFILAHELIHLDEYATQVFLGLDIGMNASAVMITASAAKKLMKLAKGPLGLVGGLLSPAITLPMVLEANQSIADSISRIFEERADRRGFAACSEEGKLGAFEFFQELEQRNFPNSRSHPLHSERLNYLKKDWIEKQLNK